MAGQHKKRLLIVGKKKLGMRSVKCCWTPEIVGGKVSSKMNERGGQGQIWELLAAMLKKN